MTKRIDAACWYRTGAGEPWQEGTCRGHSTEGRDGASWPVVIVEDKQLLTWLSVHLANICFASVPVGKVKKHDWTALSQ